MTRKSLLPILATVLVCGACARAIPDDPVPESEMTAVSLDEISPAEWQALAGRRVFFGHQSVGRDIMLGLERMLARNPQIPVRLVAAEDPATVAGPAFIEARIGRNREPVTKSEAFERIVDGGFAATPGAVAMYKFCYVDVLGDTNPDSLFADYVRRTAALRRRHPGLTIVHFTLPLHLAPTGLVEQVKTRAGMPTQTSLNIKRNRYNALLRERYEAVEPLFDLALLESTRPDGSRAFVRHRGRNVYMLAPEWTYDGGHLNDAAQDRTATRLLVFLARLGPAAPAVTRAVSASGAAQ